MNQVMERTLGPMFHDYKLCGRETTKCPLRTKLWGLHTGRVRTLPFLSCVTLSRTHHLSVPQFLHLENGRTRRVLGKRLNRLNQYIYENVWKVSSHVG